jgi:hypothetical protein
MRYPIAALIVVALFGANCTAPANSPSPYDGTWTGSQAAGACAGVTSVLTVTDGNVTGYARSQFGLGRFSPSWIGSDGNVP